MNRAAAFVWPAIIAWWVAVPSTVVWILAPSLRPGVVLVALMVVFWVGASIVFAARGLDDRPAGDESSPSSPARLAPFTATPDQAAVLHSLYAQSPVVSSDDRLRVADRLLDRALGPVPDRGGAGPARPDPRVPVAGIAHPQRGDGEDGATQQAP